MDDVLIFLPLQIMTGFLSTSAGWIAHKLPVGDAGGKFNSPIKSSVKAVSGWVQGLFEAMGLSGGWLSIFLLVIGLALIFVSLTTITKLMRKVIADRAEKADALAQHCDAHALNMITSLVVPVDQLDYYDEDEEGRE